MKAVWNGTVIAESDTYETVEGNIYFPPESVKMEYFTKNEHHTTCPWKGLASYYNIEVDGEVNENAAWFYIEPSEAAKEITDHIAFWKGVEVTE